MITFPVFLALDSNDVRYKAPPPGSGRAMTRRVKVTGDLFHGLVPDGAIYVGRAAPGLRKSPYANPFPAKTYGLAESVRRYRLHAADFDMAVLRRDLAGKDLACWCPLDQPCHADILLELALHHPSTNTSERTTSS
jgi:hypothetical protein